MHALLACPGPELGWVALVPRVIRVDAPFVGCCGCSVDGVLVERDQLLVLEDVENRLGDDIQRGSDDER